MKRVIKLSFLLMIILLWGCTEDSPFIPDNKLVVVQAYLYADEPVSDIRLTTTLPIDADTGKAPPINNADVTLIKDGQRFLLSASPGDSGYYHYEGSDLTVNADDIFNIEVNYEDEIISAETTVPEAPVGMALSDTILSIPNYYRPIEMTKEITLSWSNENEQLYFVVIENIDENPDEILTFMPSRGGKKMISLPTNRDYYTINFRSVSYRGKHRVKLYRINQEYADLYLSRQQDSRDLNEPLTNIQNGLGIFSAFNSDSLFFTVTR
jgi:hypothetical protein